MGLFNVNQYDEAIRALKQARQQHIDGTCDKGCSICGGDCHPDCCGWNPLFAMHICKSVADTSDVLHETLHTMMGLNSYMGATIGPARVVMPEPE